VVGIVADFGVEIAIGIAVAIESVVMKKVEYDAVLMRELT